MQLSRSLHLLISTFLSLTSLTSCHLRPHDVPSVNAASIPSASIQTAGNVLRNNSSTDALATKSLKRRDAGFHNFLDIGLGWNMYYSSWPAVALPVQPAAWALTYLYTTISQQARTKWTSSPPVHDLTLTYGGVRLRMYCPQEPIPWVFVGKFAEGLLRITEGGWTGVYEVMLSQADTDVSIGVWLSVDG